MYRAIRHYRPNSNWLTAGLLTLLVVSFGLFAESHRPKNVPTMLTGTDVIKEIQPNGSSTHTRTWFKFH